MKKIISEKLKFDSTEIMSDKWHEIIKEEQKKVNISFDLENDDNIGDIRKITTPSSSCIQDEDSYYVQLWAAGGDWQMPVLYFRIQVKDGIDYKKMFIYIPPQKDGNGNLMPSKNNNGMVACDNTTKDNDQRDEEKAWESVKKFLIKATKNN